MSFYRTYRPQRIDGLDNVRVREQLLSLLSKDRKDLPHAYLLTGPKGSGKTTTARILAKLYNCTKLSKKTGPCGECEQCTSIANGTNMDVLEIDAASNRGIDEIRELRDRIALAPSSGTYKVYIIDEVHMLTTEAFNALLKTLEEPPKHAIFILATTDPHKIPATIQSRCVGIPFAKASKEEIQSALLKIVEKEKLKLDEETLTYIASISEGAFRDAVKILEQASFLKGSINKKAIADLLSNSDSSVCDAFLFAVLNKDEHKALELIDSLVAEGKDIRTFVSDALRRLQALLVASIQEGSTMQWHAADVRELVQHCMTAYGQMKLSPIPELPLQLAVMEFCGPVAEKHIPEEQHLSDAPKESEKGMAHLGSASETKSRELTEINELLTVEKLLDCWNDVIEALKPYNHSVAGVLRSAHPVSVGTDTIVIATQYSFHKERLSEPKVRDILSTVFKKLFGIKARVEVQLLAKKEG